MLNKPSAETQLVSNILIRVFDYTESEKINTGKEDEENANNEELITILQDHVAGFDNSLISSSSVKPLKRKRGEENEGEDEVI